MLNMFGRGYEEIGSSDKGLILKNSGKVKIQWGKKFIDLLDSNGNLNAKVQNLIKKVSSKDDIKQDGFYYYNNILLAKIGEDIIELVHEEDNGVYVSFLEEQKTDSDQKYTALKNIGFVYPNQSEKNIYPKNGIVYIEDSKSLFIVTNGILTQYTASIPNNINDKQLIISKDERDLSEGAIVIEGEGVNNSIKFDTLKIYNQGEESILETDKVYRLKVNNKEIVNIDLYGVQTDQISSLGYDPSYGYKIYKNGSKFILNIDQINVRDKVVYDGSDEFDRLYYYDDEIYSKRFIINEYGLNLNDSGNINYLNYVIFKSGINNLDILNNSLVEIPIRTIRCNLSTFQTEYYLSPVGSISYIEVQEKSLNEKTKTEGKEEILRLTFKYDNNKLYLLDEDYNIINPEVGKYSYSKPSAPKKYYIKLTTKEGTYYYAFKEPDLYKIFLGSSLYVISEPNENPRLNFDFKDPRICLQQNDRRSTRLTEYDQIIHTKVGNIDKYKTYKDDQNKQGLFSDLSVFVGGEYRQPLPTYKRVGNTIEEVPSDIEYKHFPRYSQKLNRGMTIPIFNHDEIILPKKWVPQAANYIEDLTAFSGTLETRDDNLYEGKLFLYKISGTSSNQIQIRFKLSPQYNKFDERINDEYTEYFKFYDGSREVKENDYKQNTILLAQYKNGSINVLRNPGLITIQEDDSNILTEPNFDTLNFKDTDNIKFDLSKNNKTIVIKSDINTKLENRIKTLENKVEQLRTDLDNLSNTVSNLSSSLSSLWNTVNNLDIPPDYGSDISDLKSRVSTLEGNNNNNAS